VVGVHSAKFANERKDASVAAAVAQYGITHPVVNDAQLTLWRALGVRAWPTLAVVGPSRGQHLSRTQPPHPTHHLSECAVTMYVFVYARLEPRSVTHPRHSLDVWCP
jgi:hypothetical protein